MDTTDVVIIGAGQCGLAMSRELSLSGTDHLLLDRGMAGHSWRRNRWDSLNLLTPDWMNMLPGEAPRGGDGFSSAAAFADRLSTFAGAIEAPLRTGVGVTKLTAQGDGYLVQTSEKSIRCRAVVVATGACARAALPSFAADLPPGVSSLSALDYRRPQDLPEGPVLVVGASASGQQIARELCFAGRRVTIAVGSHIRLPRLYRGADILAWMDAAALFDVPLDEVGDLDRARRTPSLVLQGGSDDDRLDLNRLRELGIEIVGRLAAIRVHEALFSGGLANACAMADQKMNRLLDTIDDWIAGHGLNRIAGSSIRPPPTQVPERPRLRAGLGGQGFRSVIWATGFRPDHDFIDLPVFDGKGRLRHDGGIIAPGLCVMGLPYMRCRRSTYISGAGPDAAALLPHLLAALRARAG